MKDKILKILNTIDENSSEASKNAAFDLIVEQIQKAEEAWKEGNSAKENQIKELQASVEELTNSFKQTQDELKNVQNELDEAKATAEAAQREQDFQARMSSVTEAYELSAEEIKIVSKNIKDLDDSQFESWLEDFSIIAKEKSKEAIAKRKADEETKQKEVKETNASVQPEIVTEDKKEDTEDTLEDLKEKEKQSVANATVPEDNGSLFEKFKQTFKPKITY